MIARSTGVLAWLTVALVLSGCGAGGSPAEAAPGDAVTTTCPVTIPPDPGFVPPAPWPSSPSSSDMVWYGTADLWVPLPADGTYTPRKSVWWSANFPPRPTSQRPDLEIVYRRLDTEAEPVVFDAPGTNAYTAEDGSFMINGIEPFEPGCWLATATYEGVTLSYIYDPGP